MTPLSPHQDSVAELWRELSGPVRGYLRKRVASAADADDLLQEVFLRVHKQLPTLRDTSKLQGWVYRIAHNVVIDHFRSRKVRAANQVAEDDILDSASLTGREGLDLTPSLRRFVAQLPEGYREALVRHEYEGLPIREVASALGISETAAKSRVRRARLLVREMLDRCCRFEFDRRGRVIEAIPQQCGCARGIPPTI